MNTYRRVMFVGLALEAFAIVFAMACVFAQAQVPEFISVFMLAGGVTVLISSLLSKKADNAENCKVGRFLVLPLIVLCILVIFVLIISKFSLT